MRIKTQAILITEETYPIAVACLPAGFAEYPFDNVKGCWLVINVPGAQDGDEYHSPRVGIYNEWVHPKLFVDRYEVINKKPGRKPETEYWVECERSVDEALKERLEEHANQEFDNNSIIRTNMHYGRKVHPQPLVGYSRR